MAEGNSFSDDDNSDYNEREYDAIDEQMLKTSQKRQRENEMIEITTKLNDLKRQLNDLINLIGIDPLKCENKYTILKKEYIEYYGNISKITITDDNDPTKMTKLIENLMIQLIISEIDEITIALDYAIHDNNETEILKVLRGNYK